MTDTNRQDIAFDAAAVLIERVAQSLFRSGGPGETQPLQWAILRCLARQDAGGASQSWIATYLGLTHAPVSRAIATLAKRELVSKTVSSSDGRSKRVELRDAGRELLKEDPLRKLAATMGQIDQNDFGGFSRSLEKLVLNFDRS